MSNDTITYVIAGTAAGVSVIAWAALVLVPAWGSFSHVWERIVATVLSLYIHDAGTPDPPSIPGPALN